MGFFAIDPALRDMKFKGNVDGICIAARSYYLTLTVAKASSTGTIDVAPITLSDGVVYQVVAIVDSMGTGFNLTCSGTTD
ncbi:hypothetical protein IM698_01815 [Vibrio splendidus]|nr:hypothetical protein IM698_01815 [Vibrio splendidus]